MWCVSSIFLKTLNIFLYSSIKFFLFCILPAVSVFFMSIFLSLADVLIMQAGSLPVSDLIIFTFIFLDQSSNCSIAAALNVSAAPKINDLLLSLKNLTYLSNSCCFTNTVYTRNHYDCGFIRCQRKQVSLKRK